MSHNKDPKTYFFPLCVDILYIMLKYNVILYCKSLIPKMVLVCCGFDHPLHRWHKFAPGPVLPVAVAPDKNAAPRQDGQPKPKRGRPPKNPDQPPAKRGRPRKNQGQGTDEDPFTEQSAVAPIAVPPEPVLEVEDGIGGEPAQEENPVVEVPPNQPPPNQPPPPTRATFAGRTRVGSETHQKQWDDRRAKYYQMVPPEHWKDGLEREYWTLCSQSESLDDAVVKFL